MARNLLSIGECMVEFAPAAKGGLFQRGFAGDTFNTAWHFQRHAGRKWQTAFLTAIGDDPLSSAMLAEMVAANINTAHVQIMAGKNCGLYTITLDGTERSFAYWRAQSAARHLADNAEALNAAITAASDIYFSGITLAILPAAARKTLLTSLTEAKLAGKSITFDPNIRMRLWAGAAEAKAAITAAAKASTRIMPGFDDEKTLFGDASPEATIKRYQKLGAAEIIVKDGARNTWVSSAGFTAEVPPLKVKNPVDTTGAGDAFNAGYLAGRLNGLSAVASAKYGHAIATDVIKGRGALVPSKADLQDFKNA
jgi:2-dehydro-3-deoxygluconokinase